MIASTKTKTSFYKSSNSDLTFYAKIESRWNERNQELIKILCFGDYNPSNPFTPHQKNFVESEITPDSDHTYHKILNSIMTWCLPVTEEIFECEAKQYLVKMTG